MFTGTMSQIFCNSLFIYPVFGMAQPQVGQWKSLGNDLRESSKFLVRAHFKARCTTAQNLVIGQMTMQQLYVLHSTFRFYNCTNCEHILYFWWRSIITADSCSLKRYTCRCKTSVRERNYGKQCIFVVSQYGWWDRPLLPLQMTPL